MENTYGIGIANRYEMFYDQDDVTDFETVTTKKKEKKSKEPAQQTPAANGVQQKSVAEKENKQVKKETGTVQAPPKPTEQRRGIKEQQNNSNKDNSTRKEGGKCPVLVPAVLLCPFLEKSRVAKNPCARVLLALSKTDEPVSVRNCVNLRSETVWKFIESSWKRREGKLENAAVECVGDGGVLVNHVFRKNRGFWCGRRATPTDGSLVIMSGLCPCLFSDKDAKYAINGLKFQAVLVLVRKFREINRKFFLTEDPSDHLPAAIYLRWLSACHHLPNVTTTLISGNSMRAGATNTNIRHSKLLQK